MQTFETPWRKPKLFEELPNRIIAVGGGDRKTKTSDRIHFYDRKQKEYISSCNCYDCCYLHCFSENEIIFNGGKTSFDVYDFKNEKKREIRLNFYFELGEKEDFRPLKTLSANYIGIIILPTPNRKASINIFNIKKEQIVETVEVNGDIDYICPINEKQFIIYCGKQNDYTYNYYFDQYSFEDEKLELIDEKKYNYSKTFPDIKYVNHELLCLVSNPGNLMMWSNKEIN